MANNEWVNRSNIYEVNVRQYTNEGSFNAFELELPRLKDMGVEILWFMPITPISQLNKKGSIGSYYACSDYTSINPEFGDLEDFKKLVRNAHLKGFKVIIDWVANHTGWDHKWTISHPDWYKKDESGNFKKASGMDDIIELDFNNPEMRREMINSMAFWINECDIDGFRCDLAFWVDLFFWQEAIPLLNKIKPLFWIAELDPLDNPEYMEYFDAAYTWTWMHKTEAYCKNLLSYIDLIALLEKYNNAPGIKAWFTSNHDENSWNGTEYEKYNGFAKLLAVFSCTWKGMPLIYNGQELPNLKRLKFFDKDYIEWTSSNQLHNFYKTLLTLRTIHAAFDINANFKDLDAQCNELLSFKRTKENNEVIVILNLSKSNSVISISNHVSGTYKEIFTGEITDLKNELSIEGQGFRVYAK